MAMTQEDLAIRDQREPVIWALEVPPAGVGQLEYRFSANCTVERLWIRFYVGQMRNLRLWPWIVPPTDGPRERLFKRDTAGLTDDYLAGEDDVIDIELVRAVRTHSLLLVEYENVGADPLTLNLRLEYDTRNGLYQWGGGAP